MPIFTTLNAQLDEKRKGAAAAAVSLVSSSPRSGHPPNTNYVVIPLSSLCCPPGKTGVHAGMMDVEHSICCLETGWLYMIQVERFHNTLHLFDVFTRSTNKLIQQHILIILSTHPIHAIKSFKYVLSKLVFNSLNLWPM